MNKYCVYALQEPQGFVFYIGKGTAKRPFEHFRKSRKGVNIHKDRKIAKVFRENPDFTKEQMVRYIFTDLSNEKALKLEKDIIKEIGLKNLTNIVEGGEQGPTKRGEKHNCSLIKKQEAEWIKYIVNNTNTIGPYKLYNKYSKYFRDCVNSSAFERIKYDVNWTHISEKRPPFYIDYDKQHNDKVEDLYSMFVEWCTTQKSQTEILKNTKYKKYHLTSTKVDDFFGIYTRFKKEYGTHYLDEKQDKEDEKLYKLLVEWLTTKKTRKQVVKNTQYKARKLSRIKSRDYHNLFSRYKQEHLI